MLFDKISLKALVFFMNPVAGIMLIAPGSIGAASFMMSVTGIIVLILSAFVVILS